MHPSSIHPSTHPTRAGWLAEYELKPQHGSWLISWLPFTHVPTQPSHKMRHHVDMQGNSSALAIRPGYIMGHGIAASQQKVAPVVC